MESLGRLHVITDTRRGRDPVPVVAAALAAGAPVIQVRVEDEITDREAYRLAVRIAELCRTRGARCVLNDRLHIALAVTAELAARAGSPRAGGPPGWPVGGQVGAHDLPVVAARRVLGTDVILGATARDPATARAHVAAGASYLGVGPVYPTRTKTGLPDPIGPAGVAAVATAVDAPVIAIGGVTAGRVSELAAAGAHGVAVVSAVSEAADPYQATRSLLAALASAGPVRSGRFTGTRSTRRPGTPATDAARSVRVTASVPVREARGR